MRKIVLVVFTSLVIAAGAADAVAQTAGSTVSVSTIELREVATGWSAKKQILGEKVYNDTGDKVGEINDLIVTPDKALFYAIVSVGGFLGVGEHEIAVPVGQLKQEKGKIVLPGATKEALKAAPKFEYAKWPSSARRPAGPWAPRITVARCPARSRSEADRHADDLSSGDRVDATAPPAVE
jgi:hypothetical protein